MEEGPLITEADGTEAQVVEEEPEELDTGGGTAKPMIFIK